MKYLDYKIIYFTIFITFYLIFVLIKLKHIIYLLSTYHYMELVNFFFFENPENYFINQVITITMIYLIIRQ